MNYDSLTSNGCHWPTHVINLRITHARECLGNTAALCSQMGRQLIVNPFQPRGHLEKQTRVWFPGRQLSFAKPIQRFSSTQHGEYDSPYFQQPPDHFKFYKCSKKQCTPNQKHQQFHLSRKHSQEPDFPVVGFVIESQSEVMKRWLGEDGIFPYPIGEVDYSAKPDSTPIKLTLEFSAQGSTRQKFHLLQIVLFPISFSNKMHEQFPHPKKGYK